MQHITLPKCHLWSISHKISPMHVQIYLKCKFLLMSLLDLRSATCFHSRSSQTPISQSKARSLNYYSVWCYILVWKRHLIRIKKCMNVIALYKTYDLSFQKWENFWGHSVSWKSVYSPVQGTNLCKIWVNTNVCLVGSRINGGFGQKCHQNEQKCFPISRLVAKN